MIVGPKRINKRLPPSCPHASKDELSATSLSGAEQTAKASTSAQNGEAYLVLAKLTASDLGLCQRNQRKTRPLRSCSGEKSTKGSSFKIDNMRQVMSSSSSAAARVAGAIVDFSARGQVNGSDM